mmetsp:Transcript_12128/g.18101  ORF Transcript_12128/g.18101 Transcript_12128/m.18101 type:complete len:448 (+) Transcript_12128:119-1462(+)
MISIGATALTFIEKAGKVKGLATKVKSWVRDMLPTQDKDVRVLLERLCCRVDAMVRPMRFCWLWAADKESCVSDTVYHCRRTLLQVESFIRALATGEGKPPKSTDLIIVALKDHLKELDFCVQSLSLAIQIVTSCKSYHPLHQPTKKPFHISPSCLLQASTRLAEMHDTGGDVVTAAGTLLRRSPTEGAVWEVAVRRAAWKVHHDRKTRRYSMVVLDHTPATTDIKGNDRVATSEINGSSLEQSLNQSRGKVDMKNGSTEGTSRMQTFDLDGSIKFRTIGMEDFSDMENLFECKKSTSSGSNGSRSPEKDNGKKEETDAEKIRTQPQGFMWDHRVANNIRHHFAILLSTTHIPPPTTRKALAKAVLDGKEFQVENEGSQGVMERTGEMLAATTLQYITKLCIYENWARVNASKGETWTEPRHRQATDEELALVLTGCQIMDGPKASK